MLKTRLWMGALLIVLVMAVLLFDPAPYPFLLLLMVFLAAAGSMELHHLVGAAYGLPRGLSGLFVLLVLLANWPAHLWPEYFGRDPWAVIVTAFTAVVLIAFLVEMARFRPTDLVHIAPGLPGGVVIRLALLVWMTAYLGLLPSFLAQLRWPMPPATEISTYNPVAALTLAIFVPKCCDIGAYFTGRLLGRHPMSPVLSPKKTWEGLAGGLLLSAAVAVAINRLLSGPVLRSDGSAAGFGVVVGGIGALGDLAESLIKRDCRRKDASQVVPGFGGVLDVVDSIIFAAPVAYCWLRT